MAERHLLLVKVMEPETGGGDDAPPASVLSTVSLGRFADVERWLAQFNCASDGATTSMNVFYAPGVTMQLPMVDRADPVMQIMVSLNDETIAWSVLERMCRVLEWKMMDPKTGRVFGG